MPEHHPYVGVSGVVDRTQQEYLTKFSRENGLFELGRDLLLGVKATYKTQELDIENKYGSEWYPVGREICASIRDPRPNVLPVLQIFLDHSKKVDWDYTYKFTHRLLHRASRWAKGIQYDMFPWDLPEAKRYFSTVKEQYPYLRIILQCHKEQMGRHTPKELQRTIGKIGLADYVLFDASHGTGAQLDAQKLSGYVLEMSQSQLGLKIGVAGGLDAETLDSIQPILAEYPDLSWDAEARLHAGNADGSSKLNLAKTAQYLASSIAMVKTSDVDTV